MNSNRPTRSTVLAVCILTAISLAGIARVAEAQVADTLRDTLEFPPRPPIQIEIKNLLKGDRGRPQPVQQRSPEVVQAERMMLDGQYDEALELLLPLWQSDPTNSEVAQSLKRAYKGLKDYQRVKSVIDTQLKAKPDDAILLTELADAQFTLSENDAAVATIERLLANARSEPDRYNLAAQTYTNAGRYPEGIATYRRGREELGDSLIFAEELGRLFEARREYAAAVDEHFRWLAARPESRPVAQKHITNLIKVPEALPQITEALQRIVATFPKNEYAHSLYGDLLFESGAPDSAFAEYRRADYLSDTPGMHQAKGIDRCLETRQYAVARAQSMAFVTQYPDHPQFIQVNFALARAELGLDHPTIAVDMLKNLAAQLPLDAERTRIEFEIGEIYRIHALDMDSARVYFSRVVDRSGKEALAPRALMRLGDIEVYSGRLAQADSLYSRALQARGRPQDREEIQFRIAEVMLFQNEYDRCKEELNKLVKDHPRGVFVNDALELGLLLTENKDAMNWSLARYAGALFAVRRNEYDSASVLFGQLVQDSSSQVADDALFHLAGLQAERKQYDQAVAGYRSLIERFPESFLVPRAWVQIGGLFEGPLNNPEEARNAYQTVLAEYRDSPLVEEARLRLQRIGLIQ